MINTTISATATISHHSGTSSIRFSRPSIPSNCDPIASNRSSIFPMQAPLSSRTLPASDGNNTANASGDADLVEEIADTLRVQQALFDVDEFTQQVKARPLATVQRQRPQEEATQLIMWRDE
jgi:hypothetical protein